MGRREINRAGFDLLTDPCGLDPIAPRLVEQGLSPGVTRDTAASPRSCYQ